MKRRPAEGRARVSLVGESLFDKLVAQRWPRPDERTAQFELNLAGRKVGIGLDGLPSVDGAAKTAKGERKPTSPRPHRRVSDCGYWRIGMPQKVGVIGDTARAGKRRTDGACVNYWGLNSRRK